MVADGVCRSYAQHKSTVVQWFVAAMLILVWASPSLAADKAKVATTMAQQALKAYESGNYARASELYLSAFRTQPDAAYLYAAARSEHLAGHDAQAEDLYKRFIAAPGAEPDRVRKVGEYRADLQQKRAVGIAADADKAAQDDPRLSAKLYLDAWRLAPAQLQWLFQAAVAEQNADELAKAKAHLQEYLSKAPADARERAQAEARLEAIGRKLDLAAAPKTPAGQKSLVIQKDAPLAPLESTPLIGSNGTTTPTDRTLAWSTTGAGAVMAVSGLGLLAATLSTLNQFNKDTTPVADRIVTMTHVQAQDRAAAINTRMGISAALGSLGLVGVGVGTWLLVRTPARIAFSPNSIDIAVHF